ncbi:MAG TPA: Lpg1974 family pore-forming outer membrane protein [Waddliaceae bacterium]
MEKWRKKIGIAVLASAALLTFAPNMANAYNRDCDPCNNTCDWNCCGGFEGFDIGVDFLWWKPCVDDLDFCASVDEESDGFDWNIKYKGICPDWEPGVRVLFKMPSCYCDLGLAACYTYIHAQTKRSFRGDDDVACPLIHPATDEAGDTFDAARGRWELNYHDWDVLATYDIACNQCHHFKPFIGIAGNVINQKFHVKLRADSEIDTVNWSSDYWGVGLRAGAEYVYQISDCLRFFSVAHGTLLAGKADGTNHQSFPSTVRVKDDNCCYFVPGYHIGTGFSYNTCMCDWDVSFRIGYEFLVWHNVPNHRIFTGGDGMGSYSDSTSPSTRTLGFHGLLLGLGVSF